VIDILCYLVGAVLVIVGGGTIKFGMSGEELSLRVAGMGCLTAGAGLAVWSYATSPFVTDGRDLAWMAGVLNGLSEHWADGLPMIASILILVGSGLVAVGPNRL